MFCFIFVFTKAEDIDQTTIANQGIWKSATNATKVFLTIGLLTTLLLTLVENLTSGLVNGLILGLLGAFLGAQLSGIVCIQHFVLRLILWKKRENYLELCSLFKLCYSPHFSAKSRRGLYLYPSEITRSFCSTFLTIYQLLKSIPTASEIWDNLYFSNFLTKPRLMLLIHQGP